MVFRSVHHPGGAPRSYLAAQAQARPVALVLLAVMTVGLAAALQGQAILWPFVGAVAVATAAAALVGQASLHRTPAEAEVRGPFAVVRSVWDVAGGSADDRLAPVVSVRLAYDELTVGLGDAVRTFRREEWPEYDALVRALRAAAREGELMMEPPSPDDVVLQ